MYTCRVSDGDPDGDGLTWTPRVRCTASIDFNESILLAETLLPGLTGTQSPTKVENELVLVKVVLFTQSHSKSLRVFLCYTNDLV